MRRHDLEDPIIIGRIHENKVICDICEQGTTGIIVQNVLLPKDIEPSTRLIVCLPAFDAHGDETEALFDWPNVIGIGCGCYARIHRQIAHIQSLQNARKR